MKRSLIFFLLLLVPLDVLAVTLEEEIKIGARSDRYIRKMFQVSENKALQEYVQSVGQKLLGSIDDPQFEYRFTVLEDPMLNAFALPGGYIYVTTGMLAYLDSEAALAGLLGHETGHVIGHHSVKQLKKSMGDMFLIFAGLAGSVASGSSSGDSAALLVAGSSISAMKKLGYGRELELNADELGMIYAYEAGYDPSESAKMFRTLRFKSRVGGVGYHAFIATHPDTIERIVRVGEKSQILLNRGKKTLVKRDEYINMVRGLPWGKVDRRKGKKAKPEYRLEIYRTKKGDSFRSVAAKLSGDEKLAFETAVMNSMIPEEDLPEGKLIKVPVPRKLFKELSIYSGVDTPAKKKGKQK